MKFYIGRIDVALEYSELQFLILKISENLPQALGWTDSIVSKKHVDRLNELIAKLAEFEEKAAQAEKVASHV